MILKERYGIRSDGNPVIETSTYIESTEDHPMAEQIEGAPGWWVRIGVGNALIVMNAAPVSHTVYLSKVEEQRLRLEALQEEHDRQRELHRREILAKKDAVKVELRKLGLSEETVDAILTKVQE